MCSWALIESPIRLQTHSSSRKILKTDLENTSSKKKSGRFDSFIFLARKDTLFCEFSFLIFIFNIENLKERFPPVKKLCRVWRRPPPPPPTLALVLSSLPGLVFSLSDIVINSWSHSIISLRFRVDRCWFRTLRSSLLRWWFAVEILKSFDLNWDLSLTCSPTLCLVVLFLLCFLGVSVWFRVFQLD